MNHSKVCRWAVCLLVQICFVASASAQQLYYNKVDTLTFGQRFNIRTNTVDWLALTPNVGVEFTLGNKNWSKWTLGVQGRLNWNEQIERKHYYVYNFYDGRIQLRKYWHGKNPTTVFYWGVYAGGNSFDIKLNKTGRKGSSLFGGLSFGYVKQLYGYMNGSSLDLDLGVNAGVVYAKFKEYEHLRQGQCYGHVTTRPEAGYKLTFSPWIYAASTDVLRASLIYHFGPKVANKYKRRIEVDNDYRVKLAVLQQKRDSTMAANKISHQVRSDSLAKLDYEKRFEQQRLELEKKYQQDSLKKIRLKEDAVRAIRLKAERQAADSVKTANAQARAAAKLAEKQAADSIKAVKKQAKEMAKHAKTGHVGTEIPTERVEPVTESVPPAAKTPTEPTNESTPETREEPMSAPTDTVSAPADTTSHEELTRLIDITKYYGVPRDWNARVSSFIFYSNVIDDRLTAWLKQQDKQFKG